MHVSTKEKSRLRWNEGLGGQVGQTCSTKVRGVACYVFSE
jgi:hypothetical protein